MFANNLIAAPRRRRISLTALIDVVFILLMFFMLTSTFTQWRAVDVLAPVESGSTATPEQPRLMVLSASGELTLAGTDWYVGSVDALDQADWSVFDEETAVVLLPEADASVQMIVTAMEALGRQPSLRLTLDNVLPAPGQSDKAL